MENIRLNRYFMVICILLILSFAFQSLAAEPRHGGRIIISSESGVPRHFNQAVASGTATVMIGAQIFASPLRYDENWTPQPYLAKTWDFSNDNLSLTLNLVKGAFFHDGQPITSEDLAFSIMAVKNHHPFKPMFAPVKRVDTPDSLTAVIRLSHPHPAILLALSPPFLPILPKHIYGDGKDLATHPANLSPIGSGPFKFGKYVPGKYIVLERNEQFFIPGRPYLDEIMIRYDKDPSAQMIYAEHEDAHILSPFTYIEGFDRLGKSEHLVVTSKGYEGLGAVNWLGFNLLRKPLDDKHVRQAIAYSIDPGFIEEFMNYGRSKRANGPIAPGSPFYEPNARIYDLDQDKARDLLDKAGHPANPAGTRFSLTLDYIPLIPTQQHDIAFYIKRQLAKIGINVHIRKSTNFSEWAKHVSNWDFDMTMDSVYNWGDPIIGVHRTYMSDNIRKGVLWSNTQNYKNNQVDELLNLAAMEMDFTKRKSLYSQFQKILTDELPIVWLNILPYHTIFHKGLINPPISIWGIHSPLDELYWEKRPVKNYVSTSLDENAKSSLERVGIQAINLLKAKGLFGALEIFQDADSEFLNLKESGLHVIGFTKKRMVFLDNSDQMKPGMDISGLADLKGDNLIKGLSGAIGQGDNTIEIEGVWPHPITQQLGLARAWCGKLTEDDYICALEWK